MSNENKELPDDQISDTERLRIAWERYRALTGITQKEFAEQLGYTQGNFGHYLRGTQPLNPTAAVKIAKAMQIPLEELSPNIAKMFEGTRGVDLTQNGGAEQVVRYGQARQTQGVKVSELEGAYDRSMNREIDSDTQAENLKKLLLSLKMKERMLVTMLIGEIQSGELETEDLTLLLSMVSRLRKKRSETGEISS